MIDFFAQQAATSTVSELTTLAASLGTGAVAVLFAMRWVQSETEKRHALVESHAKEVKALQDDRDREKQGWLESTQSKRAEDAELLRLVLQPRKGP